MAAVSVVSATRRSRRQFQLLFDDAVRHHLAGRIREAATGYERALRLRPDYADGHNNLGAALAGLGRIDDALACYRCAISLDPNHAASHGNLGAALAAKGRFDEATGCYERALTLKPGDAGIHYNLGLALASQGRVGDAVTHYRRAVTLRPDYAEAHNNLGTLLEAEGKADEAMQHYARATAINPNHAEAHNNLGNLFRERGQFTEALKHYDRAIEIAPANPEIHLHRAEVRTFRPGDADLDALEALAGRRDLPPHKAPFVHFALAKAYEDCQNYGPAFEHLHIGNTLKRKLVEYDEAVVAKRFDEIRQLFGRPLFERPGEAGNPSPVPIFVVGMPRSGSTLIEQILASHPQIHGAGELLNMEKAFGDGAGATEIGANYLASLPALPEGKTRIVDKLPANFLNIGLIRLALPNARIIHTMRNPIDTCLSCYSKLFASGQNFTYDLAELGRYFRRYRELMSHWRSVLPPDAILDVAYEDVVGDLEGQARRMIDYCGLPWDDRCLEFHITVRPVKTASAVQVRSPLFGTSVDRWRRYEKWLGPLLRELSVFLAPEDFHHARPANAG